MEAHGHMEGFLVNLFTYIIMINLINAIGQSLWMRLSTVLPLLEMRKGVNSMKMDLLNRRVIICNISL